MKTKKTLDEKVKIEKRSNQQKDSSQHNPIVYQLTPREIIYISKHEPRIYPIIASACKEALLEFGNNVSSFCNEMGMSRAGAYKIFHRYGVKPPGYKHSNLPRNSIPQINRTQLSEMDTLSEYLGKLVKIEIVIREPRGNAHPSYIGKMSNYDQDFIILNPFEYIDTSNLRVDIYIKSLAEFQAGTTNRQVALGKRHICSIEKLVI